MPTDPKFDREQAERVLDDYLEAMLKFPFITPSRPLAQQLAAALAHIASLEKPVVPEAVREEGDSCPACGSLPCDWVQHPIHDSDSMLRSLAAENAELLADKAEQFHNGFVAAELKHSAELAALKAASPVTDGKRAGLVERSKAMLAACKSPFAYQQPDREEVEECLFDSIAMLEADARSQPASMASLIGEIRALRVTSDYQCLSRDSGWNAAIYKVLAILAKHGTPAPERDEHASVAAGPYAIFHDATGTRPTCIQLTAAEIQSGHDRVKWAEGLIRQLPEDHDGRNSWLLNYAQPAADKVADDPKGGV